ncbi:Mitochondrial folate transporter/carrier [Hypsibius exemplaris]|uniref:Solute carrier family 25 member 32 n=1 Tax=Hypsibius exemplaris TaxID=2072580 RepID=A0A9X6RMZ3_HYPEX|nr:Mitochondrial folate transporter/carrier [Hypsibius exemplaris]
MSTTTAALNPADTITPPRQSALTRLTSVLHQREQIDHLLAGISGGVVSTLILHPLDLIKVRFAVNDGTSPHSAVVSKGLRYAFAHTYREGGLRALYQGVTPNCVGAGTSWGVYFLLYNVTKNWMSQGPNGVVESLGPAQHMLAAANAGALTLLVTNPIWVVKTRLCLQYEKADLPAHKQYRGMMDCFYKIYKFEGIRGLYKGLIPGMFGVSHGALQFMAYEELKKRATKYKGVDPDTKLGTVEYLGYAAISKLFAATATYPYQVVRARLQDQHKNYTGLLDVVMRTWRREGLKGFFKGMVPNVLRITPASALTITVYEKLRLFLKQRRDDATPTA